ncbi:MAG TPA: OsmC family protein [Fluviicola sp.]|nr:OsmC family protein [Fluviicola sp.]
MKLNLHLEEQPFVLNLTNSEGLVTTIDASPEIGGKNRGMRPMQLLAGSLASCMSIDILLILKKQRIVVEKYEVEINAKRAEGVPSPFESIELTFGVDAGVPLEKLGNAVKLSHEKYCSVSASINPSIRVTTHIKHL